MKYDAVIFDLDGVICYTDEYHYQAWKAMADELGAYFDREINNRLRGVSRMASLEIVLETYDGELSQAEKEVLAEEKNERYKALLANMSPADLSDEVKRTLDTLRTRGYLLAIGSSSKNAPFILRQIGLEGLEEARFEAVGVQRFGGRRYLVARQPVAALGWTLCVEDAVSGAEAAHRGGMKAACVGDASMAGAGDYNMKSVKDLLEIV